MDIVGSNGDATAAAAPKLATPRDCEEPVPGSGEGVGGDVFSVEGAGGPASDGGGGSGSPPAVGVPARSDLDPSDEGAGPMGGGGGTAPRALFWVPDPT